MSLTVGRKRCWLSFRATGRNSCRTIMKYSVILCVLIVTITSFVVVSSSSSKQALNDDKVKLTLYYESLCQYCAIFTSTQLASVYDKIGGDRITLDLVPYGHADHKLVNGKWEFTCQHGPAECYGNKVQACALNQGYGQDIEFQFVHCVESQEDPAAETTAIYCCKKLGLDWSVIDNCLSNGQGDELLVAYGERTHAFTPARGERRPRVVPTVVFNDRYNDTLQNSALTDLMGTICSLYHNPPAACLNRH